jgi:hypothetical protein
MNRGGLAGASWELDDRFTAYDAATIEAMGFEGGKMLIRIDLGDPATARTLEACADAVSELADRRLVAIIEPFMSHREDGRLRVELTTEAAIRASAIAAGLGRTSAYTWLKVPVVPEMERVAAATTLPTVLLGGEVADDPDAAFESWRTALQAPNVVGLVVGRSLLYPHDDNVAAAVDTAVGLLPQPGNVRGRLAFANYPLVRYCSSTPGTHVRSMARKGPLWPGKVAYPETRSHDFAAGRHHGAWKPCSGPHQR